MLRGSGVLAASVNQAGENYDIGCSSCAMPCGCTIKLMHTAGCLP